MKKKISYAPLYIFVYCTLLCVLSSCSISKISIVGTTTPHQHDLDTVAQTTKNSEHKNQTQNHNPLLNIPVQSQNTSAIKDPFATATLFTDTFKATLEEVLDASLNHLSSHYIIDKVYRDQQTSQKQENPTKPLYIIEASFMTKTPNSVLDCGKIKDEAILPDGNRFSYVYNGADSPVFTMEKRNGIYMNASKTLTLYGHITLTLQEITPKKTSVTVLTDYRLTQEVIYTPLKNTRTLFRDNSQKEEVIQEMRFYTGETGIFDTILSQAQANTYVPIESRETKGQQNPDTPENQIANNMQCQAKSNIEDSILNAIREYLKR